eukprot:gene16523-20900_t
MTDRRNFPAVSFGIPFLENSMSQFANYINGAWLQGAGVTKNINPSDVTDVVGEYAQADAAQADL